MIAGMKANASYTPSNMAVAAKRYTGKTDKRSKAGLRIAVENLDGLAKVGITHARALAAHAGHRLKWVSAPGNSFRSGAQVRQPPTSSAVALGVGAPFIRSRRYRTQS